MRADKELSGQLEDVHWTVIPYGLETDFYCSLSGNHSHYTFPHSLQLWVQCLEIWPQKYCWHSSIWQHQLILREFDTISLSFRGRSSLKLIKESFLGQSAIYIIEVGFFLLLFQTLGIFCHAPWDKINTCSCLSIKRFNKQWTRQSPTTIHGSTGRLQRCDTRQFLMYTCH